MAYTSTKFKGQDRYVVTLTHNTDLDGLNSMIFDGEMDRKAFHKGECKEDIIWFTIGNDFQSSCAIQIDVPSTEFDKYIFTWENDTHVTCKVNIPFNQYNFRITKINGIDLYKLSKKFNLNDVNDFSEFIDRIISATNGELMSNEQFINQMGRQFNCMNTVREWFGEDWYADSNDDLVEAVLEKLKLKLINE